MRNSRHILLIAALALLLSGCDKSILQEREEEYPGNTISLTISTDQAELTKTTASNGDSVLRWEGDESIAVIFAKKASATTNYKSAVRELKTASGQPGVFSGTVDMGDFTQNDIVGIAYPYSEYVWGKFYKDGSTERLRIVMNIGVFDQTQKESGIINGWNCPLYAPLSISDFKKEGNNYVLSGVKLNWGCSLLRFDVYGKHSGGDTGEKLLSVSATFETARCVAGTSEINVDLGTFTFNGDTEHPTINTLLTTPAVISGSKTECVSVYMSLMPRAETGKPVKASKIVIKTDKATYEKTISRDAYLYAGVVQPIELNIASFGRFSSIIRPAARDSFLFTGYAPLANKPVKVFYNIPSGDVKTMPVLFAMHGTGRNARGCVSNWESISNKKGVVVLAPEFTKALYPVVDYQFGGVSGSSTTYSPKPQEQWTYNIIEALFDYYKEQTGSTVESYDLWGHSAGGQFTHRFLLNMPDARVHRAVGSNAGSYTVPDPRGISDGKKTYGFPYSISDMNIPLEQLRKFFARDYTVHLGTADLATTLEEDANLPVSDGAEAQGASRFERGHFFYNRSKAVADSLGLPFNWKIVEVDGVAHSATKMVQDSKTGAGFLLY